MLSASKNLLPLSLSLLPVFRAAHPARSAPALRPAPLQNWFSNQYRKEQKALPAPDAVAPRRAAASRSQDKTFAPDLRLCQSVLPVSTPSSCGIQDDLDTMAQADEPGAPAEEPAVDAILPAPRGAPQPVLAPDRSDQSSSGRRRFTAACTTLLNSESGPAQIAAQVAAAPRKQRHTVEELVDVLARGGAAEGMAAVNVFCARLGYSCEAFV